MPPSSRSRNPVQCDIIIIYSVPVNNLTTFVNENQRECEQHHECARRQANFIPALTILDGSVDGKNERHHLMHVGERPTDIFFDKTHVRFRNFLLSCETTYNNGPYPYEWKSKILFAYDFHEPVKICCESRPQNILLRTTSTCRR